MIAAAARNPFVAFAEAERARTAHKRAAAHRDGHGDGAAAATVEALMYVLRERGTAALRETKIRRWIEDLSEDQAREVIRRLIRLRPQYPAIDDALLLQLEERLP